MGLLGRINANGQLPALFLFLFNPIFFTYSVPTCLCVD